MAGGQGLNVDANINATSGAGADSGVSGFDSRSQINVGGLNVPVFPNFSALNPAPLPNAIAQIDNILLIAAAAGLGIAWIMRR